MASLVATIQVNGNAREDEKASAPRPSGEDFGADFVVGDGEGFELWLGSLEDVLSLNALRERGINAIVNCAAAECAGECAVYRNRGFSRRRTHARGLSQFTEEGFTPGGATCEEVTERPTMDRDQVRSLVEFDGDWYSDMLGYETAYCGFAADDKPGYAIDQHFEDVVAFLRQCKVEGRKVLIHCVMGINRSAASLVSCLCEELGMGLEEAVDCVSKRRGHILSNTTFIQRLIERYGLEEGGSPSAKSDDTFSGVAPAWRLPAKAEQCVRAC